MTADELLALEVPAEPWKWALRKSDYPRRSAVLHKYNFARGETVCSTEVFDDLYLLQGGEAELAYHQDSQVLHLSIVSADHLIPVDYQSCDNVEDLIALLRTMVRLHWEDDLWPPLIEEYEREQAAADNT